VKDSKLSTVVLRAADGFGTAKYARRRFADSEPESSVSSFARKPVESFRNIGNPILTSTDVAGERHYSAPELAKLWGLSERTIRRMFENEPGVL